MPPRSMNEHLSDTARVVLAFVRDHPGFDSLEIAKMLAIDDAIVRNAMAELLGRKLVITRARQTGLFSYQDAKITVKTYYPA